MIWKVQYLYDADLFPPFENWTTLVFGSPLHLTSVNLLNVSHSVLIVRMTNYKKVMMSHHLSWTFCIPTRPVNNCSAGTATNTGDVIDFFRPQNKLTSKAIIKLKFIQYLSSESNQIWYNSYKKWSNWRVKI